MTYSGNVFSMCCLLYNFVWSSVSSFQNCAYFDFPTISNREFFGEEQMQTNFSFFLQNVTCSKLSKVYIQVYKNDVRKCWYGLDTNTCNTSNNASLCHCMVTSGWSGWSVFTKTLDRTDNTMWRWSAFDESLNKIAEEYVTFRITYPAKVTFLAVNEDQSAGPLLLSVNQSARIVCLWENGNPPTKVHLLDGNGNLLATRDVSGELTYFIHTAQCNNSGLVRCEAKGSTKNISTLLLVKCPPTIYNISAKSVIAHPGEDIHLVLSARSHTTRIRECHLKHHTRNVSAAESSVTGLVYLLYGCRISVEEFETHSSNSSFLKFPEDKCHCKIVGGMAPAITLHLFLTDVKEKDTGLWGLSVSNEVDKVEVDVMIHIKKVYIHVTNLTVNGIESAHSHIVSRNTTLQVVCSWKNGNPATPVNLVDSHGNILQSSNKSNSNITYIYLPLSCHDAGVIRCEANNSTRNMSATLLVECPPVFVTTTHGAQTISAGQTIDLTFPLRTHTTYVTDCHILRTDAIDDSVFGVTFTKYQCTLSDLDLSNGTKLSKKSNSPATTTSVFFQQRKKCACRVNGTAPNLTLSVTLYITKTDTVSEHWRVILVNNIGSGQADFILFATDNDFRWVEWMTVTTVTVSLSLVAAIGLVVCIVRRVRQMSSSSPNFNASTPNQICNTSRRLPGVNVSCTPCEQNSGTSVHRNLAKFGAFQCDSVLEGIKEVPIGKCGLKFLCDEGEAINVAFYTNERPATSGSPQSGNSESSGKQDYLSPCATSEYSTLDLAPGEDNFQESCDNGQEIDFRLDNSQDPHSPIYCTLLPSPVDNKSFACLDSEATAEKDNKLLVPPKERNTQTCKSRAPVSGDESDYSTIEYSAID